MRLEFSTSDESDEIVTVMSETFAASESEEEGAVIATLTRDLIATRPRDDRVVISCRDGAGLAGAIIFSRLFYDNDLRKVFVLGPVAVETSRQKKGIGQALLKWGLKEMARLGADVAVTYGDPEYYKKVGFLQVGPDLVPPPLPLRHPFAWMAQSLTEAPLSPLKGHARCVDAFQRPEYW